MKTTNEIVEKEGYEKVDDVTEEKNIIHEGLFYNPQLKSKFEEKSYGYCRVDDYDTIFSSYDKGTETTLELFYCNDKSKLLPKYKLRLFNFQDVVIENFYFENFLHLNEFLTENAFYRLMLSQFIGKR